MLFFGQICHIISQNQTNMPQMEFEWSLRNPSNQFSPGGRLNCEFLILSIGENTNQWSEQQHLDILVMTLIPSSGSQRLSDVSYDFTYDYWLPDNFQAPDAQGYCLCNFGGCCRLCLVPGDGPCWGCGNNGCCRCVECGCSCCESPEGIHLLERRCPIVGCRPEWAD